MTLEKALLALLLLPACTRPAASADASVDAGPKRSTALTGRLTPAPGDVLDLSIFQLQPDGGHPEDRLAVGRIEADGHFSVPVTERPLLVRWYPKGASQVERVVAEGEEEVLLTTPAGVTVKGQVLQPSSWKDSPSVELRRDGVVLSNAQPAPYEFHGVTPGPATLVAYFGSLGDDNARCARRELNIGTEDLAFDLDLRASWTLEGRVVDAKGKPRAGEYVWLVDAPGACSEQRAITDARGRYQLLDVPGDAAQVKGPGDTRVSVVRGKAAPDLVIFRRAP